MDRNTVLGLLLIFVLMLGWMYFASPEKSPQTNNQPTTADTVKTDTAGSGTAAAVPQSDTTNLKPEKEKPAVSSNNGNEKVTLGIFADKGVHDTTSTIVETPLYHARFTNLGAGPASFILKKYKTWDNQPVQLIKDTTRSAYSLGFISTQNYNIETDQILFQQVTPKRAIKLAKNDTAQIRYRVSVGNGHSMTYVYTLHGNSYQIELSILFDGSAPLISSHRVELAWKPPLNYTEKSFKTDADQNMATAYSADEVQELHIKSENSKQNILNGKVDWVATRTKFFTQIIKPGQESEGATLTGMLTGPTDKATTVHHYTASIRSEIPANNELDYGLYLGPLRYRDLSAFSPSAYSMVNTGYSFLRFFSDPLVRYVIIPYFEYAGNWLGNFGIAIIVFAILVKLVLYPLTKKSFQSTAAMRQLQPELKALQEKYKNDQQKQQQELMKLYKKAKVNPLGGCLPMLLQFPILITLWRFVENSILMRQKTFLWAHDLSAPDVILHLPFSIPFMGDHISGFVLLMTISMVGQMKVTGQATTGSNPSMKAFQYVFPVMMLFIFNNLSSGLCLYYLIYNILSIGQQVLINRHIDQMELLEKVDKKKAEELKVQKLLEERKKSRKSSN